jgi:hypothetical protein
MRLKMILFPEWSLILHKEVFVDLKSIAKVRDSKKRDFSRKEKTSTK